MVGHPPVYYNIYNPLLVIMTSINFDSVQITGTSTGLVQVNASQNSCGNCIPTIVSYTATGFDAANTNVAFDYVVVGAIDEDASIVSVSYLGNGSSNVHVADIINEDSILAGLPYLTFIDNGDGTTTASADLPFNVLFNDIIGNNVEGIYNMEAQIALLDGSTLTCSYRVIFHQNIEILNLAVGSAYYYEEQTVTPNFIGGYNPSVIWADSTYVGSLLVNGNVLRVQYNATYSATVTSAPFSYSGGGCPAGSVAFADSAVRSIIFAEGTQYEVLLSNDVTDSDGNTIEDGEVINVSREDAGNYAVTAAGFAPNVTVPQLVPFTFLWEFKSTLDGTYAPFTPSVETNTQSTIVPADNLPPVTTLSSKKNVVSKKKLNKPLKAVVDVADISGYYRVTVDSFTIDALSTSVTEFQIIVPSSSGVTAATTMFVNCRAVACGASANVKNSRNILGADVVLSSTTGLLPTSMGYSLRLSSADGTVVVILEQGVIAVNSANVKFSFGQKFMSQLPGILTLELVNVDDESDVYGTCSITIARSIFNGC